MQRLVLLLALVPFSLLQAQQPPKTPKLPEGTTVERNLAFGTHERQKLDVYVPAGDGPFPLILWVHGGGWEAGSKDTLGQPMLFLAKGYAIASTNYRYSQQAPFPAQLHDVKGAVRFLKANAKKYKLDATRLGVMGGSAGGHLVALLGTTGNVKDLEGDVGPKTVSSEVQCVIDIFGPTDLLAMSQRAEIPLITKFLGGTTKDKTELAKQANPITHISKKTPPYLILHGDKDPIVPVSQSELLHDALKKAGVESTLVVIPGAGHGPGVYTAETASKIMEFADRHLKPKK